MLRAFYRHPDAIPDYLVILDMLAVRWGYADIETLLIEAPSELRRTVLVVASGACWYALHARPPRDPHDTFESNPVLRFLAVCAAIEQRWRQDPALLPVDSMAEFLKRVDGTSLARQWKVVPAAEAIEHALQVVSRDRERNAQTCNPDMRAHFTSVLDRLEVCLRARQSEGYASHLGMPEEGSTMNAPELDDKRVREAITRDLEPSNSVRDWFRIRDGILFRFAPPKREKLAALFRHFRLDTIIMGCEVCPTLLSLEVSQFDDPVVVKCGVCGWTKSIPRSDIRHIIMPEG
jgi:hypothetical protein